jgi:diacylglycerol kinase (ATP)
VRITLVHNPEAGGGVHKASLVALLEDAGHRVRAVSTKQDWRKALRKPTDLVVAAGGDGTLHKVALAVADTRVPMAILPLGTANNVGKTLEILGDARAVIAAWEEQPSRPFDLGHVSASWGDEAFVESFGGGAFATLIGSGEHIETPSVLLGRQTDRALHHLGVLLAAEGERPWAVSIDGQQHDGRYVAVEVLNIRFIGPNVPLAPEADPGDGLMDVVLVGADERDALQHYIARRIKLAAAAMPSLPVVRGRDIRLLAPAGVRLHMDDELWPSAEPIPRKARIGVTIEGGALQLLR